MIHGRSEILILGAGLQGAGVALELGRRGFDTTLVERDSLALNRASLRNEGKIHLGLIYANDPSRDTAFLQLHGALRFRKILSRWIDPAEMIPSTSFHYLVANDSLATPDLLRLHYAAVEGRLREQWKDDPTLDYLGERPEWLVRPLDADEIAAHYDPSRFLAGFETAERAVNCDRLALALRRAVAAERRVTFRPSHVARAIVQEGEVFRVEGDGPEGAWCIHAPQVVNATWERRAAFDRQLGILPARSLLHRLKYRVIARLTPELRRAPSVTMVLGRYGDVVVRDDGTAYLSWYPAGLRGWSHELEPPDEWDAPCRGDAPPGLAREIGAQILAEIDRWYPGIGRCEPIQVDAGAIVAIGTSDVDDASSGLHHRSRIGVTSRGGYHSVDPGKLTTAPWFAIDAADRIEAALGPSLSKPVARLASSAVRSAHEAPAVVALVPAWNAASFIARTLGTLTAQTYPHLEILVSDDASPDRTAEVCEAQPIGSHPLRVLRQPRNLGWVGNVNALLKEARGDYLLFAFQDDLPEPTYVERCVAALEADPTAVMAFSDIELVHQDGRRETRVYDLLDGPMDRLERAKRMAGQLGNWWIPNRGVFRASAARDIGGLRRHAAGEFSADWPWLLHMSLLGSFVRVPERLCTKIYQPRSLSRTWDFGARSWCAVTASACGTVKRASIPPAEKWMLLGVLARFAWRHVREGMRAGRGGARETTGGTVGRRRLDPMQP